VSTEYHSNLHPRPRHLTVFRVFYRMPPEDPAFPPGRSSVKREMAKRLWAVLVYQDVSLLLSILAESKADKVVFAIKWLGANSRNRCYAISPMHCESLFPSLCTSNRAHPFPPSRQSIPTIHSTSTILISRLLRPPPSRHLRQSSQIQQPIEFALLLLVRFEPFSTESFSPTTRASRLSSSSTEASEIFSKVCLNLGRSQWMRRSHLWSNSKGISFWKAYTIE